MIEWQLGRINILRPRQNGCHFADDIFKFWYIFWSEHALISRLISNSTDLGFHWTLFPINNIPALVQIIAWYRNRRQAIICTNYDLVYWGIDALLGINELIMSLAETARWLQQPSSSWPRPTVSTFQYFRWYVLTKSTHDDVIKWKHFPLNWPFVRGIHRSQVNSPHKGQWCGDLMFSLVYAGINGWVNNGQTPSTPSWHHCNGM